MIRYEMIYKCESYTTYMYEILVWWDSTKVGCIYYLEDQLKSTIQIDFDEWHRYREFKDLIPSFDPKEVANQVILEHHLLETDSIII